MKITKNKIRKVDFKSNSKPQLFLLHFAGGSCYSFDFIRKYFDDSVEFIALELPGRGRRFEELILRDKKSAIHDYFEQVKSLRNKMPFLIYGHSMGATLGLNVANLMQRIGDPPAQLIVSGNPGPDAKKLEEDKNKGHRYLMNDEDFKETLRELGGVPEEVIENNDLYDFFSPILRADFELLEKDDFLEKGICLDVPIYAMMGDEEKYYNQIENWNRFTENKFQYLILEGDHFFIHNYPSEIANLVKMFAKKLIVMPSAS